MPRDRAPTRLRLQVSAVLALVLVWACDRAPARDVTLTSATRQRAEELPPASRTVDSAGWVDNGGRTSSERGRTEMSGMRATETGSQVPTGTPAIGLPLPLGPEPRERERERETPESRLALGAPQPSGGSARVVAQMMSRAYCDREWACGRISVREAWASKARCIANVNSRFDEDVGAAGCPESFDPDLVPACLTTIRQTPCDAEIENIASLPGCNPRSLCLPR